MAEAITIETDEWAAFLKLNGQATLERCWERERYWSLLLLELEGAEHAVLQRLRFTAERSLRMWRDLRESKMPRTAA